MEYPTSGWVNFQSATLGQFCIGGYTATRRRLNDVFAVRNCSGFTTGSGHLGNKKSEQVHLGLSLLNRAADPHRPPHNL